MPRRLAVLVAAAVLTAGCAIPLPPPQKPMPLTVSPPRRPTEEFALGTVSHAEIRESIPLLVLAPVTFVLVQ